MSRSESTRFSESGLSELGLSEPVLTDPPAPLLHASVVKCRQREHNVAMSMMAEPQVFHRTPELVAVIVDAGSTDRAGLTQAGHLCVKKAVAELVGRAQGDIVYSDVGAPEWLVGEMGGEAESHGPSGIQISIAHTNSVAVGVASTVAVGVDLEQSDRDVSRLFRGLGEQERDLVPRYAVLEILCAKEAAGKAQNIGLAGSIKRWLVSEDLGQLRVTDLGGSDHGNNAVTDLRVWTIEIVRTRVGSMSYTCAIAVP